MNHEKLRELLAPYALGILEADERLALEAHLRAGCAECGAELREFEAATAALALSVTPVAPPDSLRERILLAATQSASRAAAPSEVQIWKNWSRSPAGGEMSLVRSDEGAWEPTGIEGVSVKKLSFDPDRRQTTMLVRMLPGTGYPRHRHSIAEECFVVEGDLHVGDIVMHAGDFQRAEAASVHPTQFTESGCLLLVTSSLEDELLA